MKKKGGGLEGDVWKLGLLWEKEKKKNKRGGSWASIFKHFSCNSQFYAQTPDQGWRFMQESDYSLIKSPPPPSLSASLSHSLSPPLSPPITSLNRGAASASLFRPMLPLSPCWMDGAPFCLSHWACVCLCVCVKRGKGGSLFVFVRVHPSWSDRYQCVEEMT